MFCVVSPAKKLDYDTPAPALDHTGPVFLDDTVELSKTTKNLSRADLSRLMKISDKLADLNHARFQGFSVPFDTENAKQAALAFSGDTYVGLDAKTLDKDDFAFAQDHFGILSGFYGLLRPLDLMQPYRLEMGTRLENPRGNNLYEFWGSQIAERINEMNGDGALINCASNEYFKAVDKKALKGEVITPVFKEIKSGVAKTIGLMAKRARGTMARYIIQNRIDQPEAIKDFTESGYVYREDLSRGNDWVFTAERE
ncbi:peroxide stress protein YaaA [Terasakiella sp. A23]|uniref:peroxide stress protein YaaA n=1 Tax=Terasakiella sp. FCG-A23 TaxID=3080561 RepID=UPI0029542148|nr:peroxide stress protein YaaA [Terasakiella sp. A23]MDV7338408.1 peroxide stress protein YaaA [Terasakiella sp. A23]